MNPFTVFTLSGPLIGAAGFFLGWSWLFWIGVALSVINLVLNVASGVMKLPVLPVVCIIAGAIFYESPVTGAGLGLLAWTLLEGVGEIFGMEQSG